ncbi:MAG: hypothetical protein NVSMB4_01140 [Acidimicrobiales bacterium]
MKDHVTAMGMTGSLVGGRYRIDRVLGRGGMGVVWAAMDTLLERPVALKEIHLPPVLDDTERRRLEARVLREARASARLSHPSVVAVYDVVDEGGRPFIVMELVKAPSLAELVGRRGPLPRRQVAEIGTALASALAVAHSVGIVHRDVKPGNVLVPDHGPPRLTDFGIASITDDSGATTTTQQLIGSPTYMSPEQAKNLPLTAATDRWSLGATLYYAVEGVPPFDRGEAIPTLTSILGDEPRAPQRAGSLAPVILSLLAKKPGERPSDAQLAAALRDVVGAPAGGHARIVATTPTLTSDDGPETAMAPAPHLAAAVSPTLTHVPSGQRSAHPPPPSGNRPRSRVLYGAAALIAALLLAGGAALLTRHPRRAPTARAATSAPPVAPIPVHPSSTATPATTLAAAVPANWVAYRDASTGFTISHPPGWTVTVNGTLTDFRDPATGAYLRVDHRSPPDPSPEADWRAFEPSFAAANPGYRQIQITPTTYEGYRAATWEYTYGTGGVSLHAVDLGFVVGSRYGFALNFQTSASDWDRMQAEFMAFQRSFRAPST